MNLDLEPTAPPLTQDEDGIIRVASTRVTLESVISTWLDGATVESIVEQFPALDLADVHASLAYFLRHRDEVDAYLRECAASERSAREEVERRFPSSGLRARLIARSGP